MEFRRTGGLDVAVNLRLKMIRLTVGHLQSRLRQCFDIILPADLYFL